MYRFSVRVSNHSTHLSIGSDFRIHEGKNVAALVQVGDMAQVHGPLMTIRVAKGRFDVETSCCMYSAIIDPLADPDAEEAAPEAAPEAAVESSPTTPSGDSHGEPPNVGKAHAIPTVPRCNPIPQHPNLHFLGGATLWRSPTMCNP